MKATNSGVMSIQNRIALLCVLCVLLLVESYLQEEAVDFSKFDFVITGEDTKDRLLDKYEVNPCSVCCPLLSPTCQRRQSPGYDQSHAMREVTPQDEGG